MRFIDIITYEDDPDNVQLRISKDVKYVLYKGEFIRVNVDKDYIIDEESDVFPSELDSDILDKIADVSDEYDEDDASCQRIYYSDDNFTTVDKLFSAITETASYSKINTKILYETQGIKTTDGEINFTHYTKIAFKMGELYVPVVEIKEPLVKGVSELLVDANTIFTVIVTINAQESKPFKQTSTTEINIISDNEISLTTLKKDSGYAENIIKSIFVTMKYH